MGFKDIYSEIFMKRTLFSLPIKVNRHFSQEIRVINLYLGSIILISSIQYKTTS